jgi:hypothetical protein
MATYPFSSLPASPPFPSAAIYHPPPLFPGGYYTSPYPFFYSTPPAFPYAATYPHPTSAYMPAPTHEGIISTQSPTHVDPNHLPPAPTPIHGDLSLLSIPHARPKQQQHKEWSGKMKKDCKATAHYDCALQIEQSGNDLTNGNKPSNVSINDEKLVPKNMGSNRHVVTQQAQIQSSFDSLHGAFSKLSTLVSQLAVSMGTQTTEASATDSSLVALSAPIYSSAPSSTAYASP